MSNVTRRGGFPRHFFKRVIIAVLLLGGAASLTLLLDAASAQDAQTEVPDAAGYTWSLVADGFDRPLYVTHASDGSGRLFVLEQTGGVWILQDGAVSDVPFLDLSDRLPPNVFRGVYSEQGLLGLAFHPDYAENGYLYVNYTDVNGDTVVSRFQVSTDDPNMADPDSELVLFTLDQPFENHNSGHMAFGPDGMLYISFGDGGDQGDPMGNAQNPQSLLGKMLRIDVDGGEPYAIPADNPFADDPAYAGEIWMTGLRNPWRFSFDRTTGDFYLADVGEWLMEEINFVAAADAGGQNFGWEYYEGTLPRDGEPILNADMPVLTYDHTLGCSVTGGYVYRGAQLPALDGFYFYGDYCVGNLWLGYRDDAGTWNAALWMETRRQISSFGEDEAGELYLVDYKGEVLRLENAG